MFFGLGTGYAPPARAGTLYGDWNYAIDSFSDGLEGEIIGSQSRTELYGMAMKEEDESIYFAFNSNLSLGGFLNRRSRNRRISYGDLFINFSSTPSSTANTYGIRFDAFNDSILTPGLYQGVFGVSFSRANTGFTSLGEAHAAIATKGGTVSYGDVAADHFPELSSAITTLYGGDRLGNIEVIRDVTNLGLDFSAFGATGTETFGIRVDRKLLPSGEFTANVFVESGNDGMALKGILSDRSTSKASPAQTVPEPGSLLGLGLLGLATVSRRLWKQLQTEVVF